MSIYFPLYIYIYKVCMNQNMFHMEPRLRFWGSIPSSKTSIGLEAFLFSKLSLSCSTLAMWRSWVARLEERYPSFPSKIVEGHRVVSSTIKYAFANSNLKTSGKKKAIKCSFHLSVFPILFFAFFGAVQKCQENKTVGSCWHPKSLGYHIFSTLPSYIYFEWVFCFIDAEVMTMSSNGTSSKGGNLA